MKISPSPWLLSEHGSQVLDWDGKTILEYNHFAVDDPEIHFNNVKLAALAPEMFDLLNHLVDKRLISSPDLHNKIKDLIVKASI
jgi:hypothetical protein